MTKQYTPEAAAKTIKAIMDAVMLKGAYDALEAKMGERCAARHLGFALREMFDLDPRPISYFLEGCCSREDLEHLLAACLGNDVVVKIDGSTISIEKRISPFPNGTPQPRRYAQRLGNIEIGRSQRPESDVS